VRVFALLFAFAFSAVNAQTFPIKTMRLVSGVTPGSASDTMARVVAEKMSASLGVPVIVENRLGAGGVVAAKYVASAEPDGHLISIYTSAFTVAPLLNPGTIDPKELTAVATLGTVPTVLIVNQAPFNAKALLGVLERSAVTTFCAPPTVWRLLIQEDLAACKVSLREVCGAGEPLNPEVINKVHEAWGLTIRDGYGQTETTAIVANSPGQKVKPGAMGRPLPGYRVLILDADGMPRSEGEICLDLNGERPAGLMQGYADASGALSGANDQVYRTGDVASLDEDGYLTFVGRADDVFKSSDYRISPFELESVLIEHEAVAEAAIVPSPDEIRLSVPKAYILLIASAAPSRETAQSILKYTNQRLAPFKRIRRLEFVTELPKTISGKIRRAQLRRVEYEGSADEVSRGVEFHEKDLLG